LLQAMPVPQLVPSVLRLQPVMSVTIEVTVVQAPAAHVGVMTELVRLPELSQTAA
jgi:hypothetical protein